MTGGTSSGGRVLVVTGTDTGVGKTVATAALAAAALARGCRVLVDKPVQTGVGPCDVGDAQLVAALAGGPVGEGVRLPRPMAPVQAADADGVRLPGVAAQAERLRAVAPRDGLLIVEGAGGLLVRLDHDGATLADLVALLPGTGVVVVVRAGLGTLNHTELTLEALGRRGLPVAGLVVGAWPARPDEVDLANREHLAGLGVPLLGALPAGAGALPPGVFRAGAVDWLPGFAQVLGGAGQPDRPKAGASATMPGAATG